MAGRQRSYSEGDSEMVMATDSIDGKISFDHNLTLNQQEVYVKGIGPAAQRQNNNDEHDIFSQNIDESNMDQYEDENNLINKNNSEVPTFTDKNIGSPPQLHPIRSLKDQSALNNLPKIIHNTKVVSQDIYEQALAQANFYESQNALLTNKLKVAEGLAGEYQKLVASSSKTAATIINNQKKMINNYKNVCGSSFSNLPKIESLKKINNSKDKLKNNTLTQQNQSTPIENRKKSLVSFNASTQNIDHDHDDWNDDEDYSTTPENTNLMNSTLLKINDHLDRQSKSKVKIDTTYRLKKDGNYRLWYDHLTNELIINNLLDVIKPDDSINKDLSVQEKKNRNQQVRSVIISRIDDFYHKQIINLTDPIKILEYLKNQRQIRANLTHVTVRTRL